MTNYQTTWWQRTGEMSPFVGGVSSPLMRNVESGEVLAICDLPIGALYPANREWCTRGPNAWPPCGADGLSIICKTIESHWYIDSQASNCTKPDDVEHRCWVRHGTIGEKVTVDKNGNTCGAGAGSFFMGKDNCWHGFLRKGILVQA